MSISNMSIYEQLGGEAAVHRLVNRFYEVMDTDTTVRSLRDMHPADLARSKDSLFKFLSGWLGGPPLFMQERGHPRLRMRHAPFAVNRQARDDWMQCMRTALAQEVADPELRQVLNNAFAGMADHLINAA